MALRSRGEISPSGEMRIFAKGDFCIEWSRNNIIQKKSAAPCNI